MVSLFEPPLSGQQVMEFGLRQDRPAAYRKAKYSLMFGPNSGAAVRVLPGPPGLWWCCWPWAWWWVPWLAPRPWARRVGGYGVRGPRFWRITVLGLCSRALGNAFSRRGSLEAYEGGGMFTRFECCQSGSVLASSLRGLVSDDNTRDEGEHQLTI